ncbi:MAG TPA: Gfo/Idh/MocA family oxidoreductase [Mycobacteriales bacterium]|nr:Gfo/Idh/MocA family oxidoreductase [Mycobacteriales bacterium]
MPVSPVRWGFLGAGGIAYSSLGPALAAADGAVLHAAAARDPDRAAGLAPAVVYAGYADLLADENVEAVYVSLHNEVHRQWTLAALAAGKHVLCEKPLGLTAAEVDEMTAAADRADLLLVEAVWNRWHPRTREAEQLVGDGAVGTVRRVVARFDGGTPPAAGNYRFDPGLGGGSLYDVGCYAIAGALWAFGWQRPTEVTARAELWPTGADLLTVAELRFAGGGTAEILAGFTGSAEQRLEITGTTGTLELVSPAYSAATEPATLRLRTGDAPPTDSTWPPTNAYRLMVEEVSRAVRGEPATLVPLSQSRAGAAVLDRIRAATGPTT